MPDYGCNISINNHTDWTLVLSSVQINSGNWASPPPQEISGGSIGKFRLNDNFGLTGADGSCIYYVKGQDPPNLLALSFACPVGFWNSNSANVKGPNNGYTTVTSNSSGSPLNATYHVFSNDQTLGVRGEAMSEKSALLGLKEQAMLKERVLAMDDDDDDDDDEYGCDEPARKSWLRRWFCL